MKFSGRNIRAQSTASFKHIWNAKRYTNEVAFANTETAALKSKYFMVWIEDKSKDKGSLENKNIKMSVFESVQCDLY